MRLKSPATMKRYGTVLRCYDNGGKSADRYTIIPPRWAHEFHECRASTWSAIAADETPFHPLGIGCSTTAMPGPHLGKRVKWDELPKDVQTFARDVFPEYAPEPLLL